MATFGFGTITSQGVGANIDVAGIVNQLMQIERIPLNSLIAQKDSFEAKISALGTIKSSLSSLQTSLAGLKTGDSILANKATSSDTTILNATGTTGAVAGNYSISSITQLAQSQKLVATGQASSTAAIGTGTSTVVTIDLGTTSGATFTPNGSGPFNITIDSANNTLEGIRDEINNANAGVTATIVNDGDATNPYRLVLTSTSTGADQSMKITTDAADATIDGLLTYDPAGTMNLTETSVAQNANFTVDGLAITKSSNTVTDVISGVTLELKSQTATPVTVSVSQDTDTAKTAVEDFVTAYNDLLAEINKQTDSGYSGGSIGALASDSVTRQMLNYIREEITTAPTGITGSYNSLTSIGVSFQRDGTLAVDDAILTAAIQDDNNNVAELFSSADGYATRIDAALSDLLSLNGTIALRTDAFNDRISLLEDRQTTLEGRLDRTEARLRAQFTNLDVMISSLSVTSNYLTQQLDILNAQSSG